MPKHLKIGVIHNKMRTEYTEVDPRAETRERDQELSVFHTLNSCHNSQHLQVSLLVRRNVVMYDKSATKHHEIK